MQEYTPRELEDELSSRFAFHEPLRQNTWITAGVLDDNSSSGAADRAARGGPQSVSRGGSAGQEL